MSDLIFLGNEKQSELISKQFPDFQSLFREAVTIQDECKDISVGPDSTYMIDFTSLLSGLYVMERADSLKMYQLSKHSINQLCQKIGMNVSYYNTCYNKGAFDLLDRNMNHWISECKDKKFLFRIYKDSYVRGILSNRYSIFDTPKILDTLFYYIDVCSEKYSIVGAYLSPERFHLRVIQNRKLLSDDDLFVGFTVDSSDVGRCALSVKFFIYKQVCSNGLCIPQVLTGFSHRHIGIHPSKLGESLKSVSKNLFNFREVSKDLINTSKVNSLPVSDLLDKDSSLVEYISTKSTLSKDLVVNRVVPLIDKYYGGFTVFNLVNAITEVAQDFTLERRLELEGRAGELLTLKV